MVGSYFHFDLATELVRKMLLNLPSQGSQLNNFVLELIVGYQLWPVDLSFVKHRSD